jgi:hypothetical protein
MPWLRIYALWALGFELAPLRTQSLKPRAEVPETQTPRDHWSAAHLVATHTVIGTLRPTDRRRAFIRWREIYRFYALKPRKMELRGIEPLTSAVRLQRSPS